MVLFFDVTNRLNVFLSFFRRETTGLLLVLLLGICTPATVRSVFSTSTLRGVHTLDSQ